MTQLTELGRRPFDQCRYIDPVYRNLPPPRPLGGTILGNDSAGIDATLLSPAAVPEGGRVTWTVALTSEPTGAVFVILVPRASAGYDIPVPGRIPASGSLTFTPLNWFTPQTAGFEIADNAVDAADGRWAVNIVLSEDIRDPVYLELPPPRRLLGTILNNDGSAGIDATLLSPVAVQEGGRVTWTMALTWEPTGDVVVVVDPRASAGYDIPVPGRIPASRFLTFTPLNWFTPQTAGFEIADNAVDAANGRWAVNVVLDLYTRDPFYRVIPPVQTRRLFGTILDNDGDGAGIDATLLSPAAVQEGGRVAWTVALTSEPTGDVVVVVDPRVSAGYDIPVPGRIPASGSLTFTPLNWSTPQTAGFEIADNAVDAADGRWAVNIVLSEDTRDPVYHELLPPRLLLGTILDNDITGIDATLLSPAAVQEGGRVTWMVALTSEPTGDVVVVVDPRVSAGYDIPVPGRIPASGSLTFTPLNWFTPQTAGFEIADNAVDAADGRWAVNIVLSEDTRDPVYHELPPPAGSSARSSTTTAPALMSLLSPAAVQEGGRVTWTVALTSPPTGDVVVVVDPRVSADYDIPVPGRIPASGSLTFTPLNWSTPQTAGFEIADNAVDAADGRWAVNIVLSEDTRDPVYHELPPPRRLLGTILDNDSAGIDVTLLSPAAVQEGGRVAWTMVLTSVPTGAVVVVVDPRVSADYDIPVPGRIPASGSLTFTPLNWFTPQTAGFEIADNAVDAADGRWAVNIVLSEDIRDPVYHELPPPAGSSARSSTTTAPALMRPCSARQQCRRGAGLPGRWR